MTSSSRVHGWRAFAGVRVQAGLIAAAIGLVWLGGDAGGRTQPADGARWLAGDHHIHSEYSVGWDRRVDPPALILGRDAIYSIPRNARMARRYGLEWTVATDHGGPDHSRIYLEMAYPELLRAREEVPQVVQFFGLELNTPGGDHSSLIVPHGPDEAQRLYDLESRFDRREAYPEDPSRDTEAKMVEALEAMNGLAPRPVVIANHPSRSRSETGDYRDYDPAELRRWNDTAPDVAIGMEGGAGGTRRAALVPARTVRRDQAAGATTSRYRYLGRIRPADGTAGRASGTRCWGKAAAGGSPPTPTPTSTDTEGGIDFWPGEYSKTYVHAEKSHAAILEGAAPGARVRHDRRPGVGALRDGGLRRRHRRRRRGALAVAPGRRRRGDDPPAGARRSQPGAATGRRWPAST